MAYILEILADFGGHLGGEEVSISKNYLDAPKMKFKGLFKNANRLEFPPGVLILSRHYGTMLFSYF